MPEREDGRLCDGCRIYGDCPVSFEANEDNPDGWRPPCWKSMPAPADSHARAIIAELETRLADMGRVQTETLDRLHEVERQRDDLDLRLRRALDRAAQGHTAEADGYVSIPLDVARQVAAAVVACEPYQRGQGLDTTREP